MHLSGAGNRPQRGPAASVEAVPNVRAQTARGQARLQSQKAKRTQTDAAAPAARPRAASPRPDRVLLIAVGVYLAFVLFFGWEGGKVGYGIETGLEYLVGSVGARIATVLLLVVGAVIVTGTSISSIFRGAGRGLRRAVLGGRGVAETAILHREERRQEKTASDFDTRAGATDVMSTYPDEEEFEPTVALSDADDIYADGPTGRPRTRSGGGGR